MAIDKVQRKTCRKVDIQLPSYGIWVESHRHEPGFSTDIHIHKYTSLIYVVSGQGKCIIADKEYSLCPNSAVMLAKGKPHQLIDEPKKAMTVFVLYFGRLPKERNEKVVYPLLDYGSLIVPLHYAKIIRKELRQMLYEQESKPGLYEIAIQQALVNILLNLYRVSKSNIQFPGGTASSTDRAKSVLDYVARNYYQSHNLSDAARAASTSRRQFANLCRRLTGRSFIQFLNSVRIQHASKLLAKTTIPVSAIAFEVGFEELSTFYRAFKKHTGLSPLTFR
jgi:AraC-like DNA-binding protein/mannose-6-phosphate isomerase-like protein (cupin superfamily)